MSDDEEEEWKYKDYNRWEEDGAIVENAHHVIHLDLFRTLPTHTLSDNIGKLIHLIKLDLRFNQLTTLPDSICNLTHLRRLYLNNNELTSLPESIGDLSELETLHLQKNQLTSLPESIGDLSELETLHLQKNQLTSLPDSIGELYNLFVLRLDNNNLTTLPDSMLRLYNLETLNLDNNQLTTIFDELLMIQNISYENNPITIKGYDPTSQIPVNVMIMANTDPYYVYLSPTNRVVPWIEQGGGVTIPRTYMGCGLNVLSCLGFIDRSELPPLIMEQDENDQGSVKSGMRLSSMIDMSIHEPSSFYRFFIPFGEDKEDIIRFALNEITQSLKLPGAERYRYMIVKLVISKYTGLGHTMLVAYDSSTDTLSTFDPQNCTPDKTTVRSFDSFAGYLLNSFHYQGLSVIKYKTSEDREGGIRKRRTIKGKRKTAKKKGKRKTSRNAGRVHREAPFGLSNTHKMLSKPNIKGSKSHKMVSKNDTLFNQLVDFVTEGEKNDKKTNKLLFEVNQSLKGWTL